MYTMLRELADSWAMLLIFMFFIGVVFWAFRPGSRALHEDLAQLPLRDDDVLPDDSGEK